MKNKLTKDKLLEMFTYDKISGIFYYKIRCGKMKPGLIAGSKRKDGYVQIRIFGSYYYAHRLAFLYLYGEMPSQKIDHINRNPSDNMISNLRPVTDSENCLNTRLNRRNKSGYRGVAWNSKTQKWEASLRKNKKTIHLGHHSTIKDAANAYKMAAKKIFSDIIRFQ